MTRRYRASGMKRLAFVFAALASLAAPAAAAAAPDKPFGHACSPQNGVRFCATKNDNQRVKSFDGVPLDVDVTLPATGSGPFPTIVMLHGFPGTKASFESDSPNGSASSTQTYHWNNTWFAQHGYAVVNYSARGFGRSCGVKGSRTKPECNKGWFHFADQRYEVHDTQYLLGLLVDEGVTDGTKIGVTGTSYGGGQAMQLAFLKNRVRNVNGSYAPWKSPGGKPLFIEAAWPRWGWSDFIDAVAPNGRFLDYKLGGSSQSISPLGVAKKAVVDALYIGGLAVGYLAPQGADPTADLKTWHDEFFAGEPYNADVQAVAQQFLQFKSASGITGKPSPLLIMDGWTDPVFGASQALRPYNRLRKSVPGFPVSLQLGDLGHFRAGNALALYQRFNDDGTAFLDRYVRGTNAAAPAPGSVTVFGQGCPKGTIGFGPIVAKKWTKLARGDFRLGKKKKSKLTADGGDSAVGTKFNPVTNSDPCSTTDAGSAASGTAVLSRKSKGFTLAGLGTISAKIKAKGSYGQIDARLFDVTGGQERLIDSGTYRLKPNQKGKVRFQLFGNAYKFAKGHKVKLELLGRNDPSFLPDAGFTVAISKVRADLPTREKRSRKRGISKKPKLK